jgi:hypothetical protein
MLAKLCVIATAMVAATAYPPYKQCDPDKTWGGDTLGIKGEKTICAIGCAMSSVAMILQDCKKRKKI